MVPVTPENLPGSRRREEIEKSGGGGVVPPGLQQHGLLPDGSVEVFGYEPAGPPRGEGDLRERQESQVRVSGTDELVGLGDVRSDYPSIPKLVVQLESPEDLHRRPTVGSERRVCQRDPAEVGVSEDVGPVHPIRLDAEEHEPAHRIRPPATGNRESLPLRQLRASLVRGEEHLEGSALHDLGIELSRGPEAQERPVSGGVLERGRDLPCRGGEVGGYRGPDASALSRNRRRRRPDNGGREEDGRKTAPGGSGAGAEPVLGQESGPVQRCGAAPEPRCAYRVAVIMISTLMPAPIIWVSTVARAGGGAPTTSRYTSFIAA